MSIKSKQSMETKINTPEAVVPADYHTKLKLNRADIFDADSWLSKSAMYELYGSSLYKWRYHPRSYGTTPAMTWGSMVDCLVTCDEDQFDKEFAINPYDSMRTKQAKEWKAEQEDEGKIIVTGELCDQACKAVDVLTNKHECASSIIKKSIKQVLLKTRINWEGDKIGMKGLVDFAPVGERYLVDLKTTRDFSTAGFRKNIQNFGYHLQASHYLGLWNAQNPDDYRDGFRIIWQESSSPYEVAVTEIPQVDLADGTEMLYFLIKKLVRATKTNNWPMKYPEPIILGRASYGEHADAEETEGGTPAV